MMPTASSLDVKLGMEVYASKGRGIGGRLRSKPEDFIVEEILLDGLRASVRLRMDECKVSGRGRYLICILIKRGWDTLKAVEEIARRIDINPEMISIAGIKDSRALTAQHISIGAVSPERAKVKIRDAHLIPIRYADEKISPHILYGNRFDITVREIRYTPAETQKMISEILGEISELGGIPNFFGHQRFGTIRPITHLVGKFMLKGRFEDAVMLFLSETGMHESPRAREAREMLRDTRDFKSALKIFPRGLIYERLMLRYLSKYPRDFLGALSTLPVKLKKLFIQAYQSYLFNRFLSERMKREIPLDIPEVGDFAVEIGSKGLPIRRFTRVKLENMNTIASKIKEGSMALALPIIGFDQELSGGVQGEIEREILEQEGVKPQDFKLEGLSGLSMHGGLRRMLVPVIDLKFMVEDADNGAVANFKFTLHRGSYATVLLREFMKPEDPASSGF